jgi:uronate dehydrogenase
MSSPSVKRPFRPKVLVTGAGGNIGLRSLAILEQSMDLRLTDLVPMPDDSRYRAADLTNFSQAYELLEGMDAVIHLAMADGPPPDPNKAPGTSDPVMEQRLRVNIGATYHILEAARQRGLRRVVYASSLTIHLGNKHRKIYNSTTPVEPTGLYACTKLFGENLAKVYWRNHGLSTICLRIGQPTPIGHEFDDLWRTNVRARSHFVEIQDVARGLACGVHTDVPFGIFNLVSASDNPRFDLSESQQIGYRPQAYFSNQGFQYSENSNFPDPPAAVLTHNPGEKEASEEK